MFLLSVKHKNSFVYSPGRHLSVIVILILFTGLLTESVLGVILSS